MAGSAIWCRTTKSGARARTHSAQSPTPMEDKDIFLQALELESPEERKAFLDEACGDDVTLRALVDELLDSSAEAGEFLETPAVVTQYDLSTLVNTEEPVPLDFLAPSDAPDSLGRIGHYEVESVLGQGGAGVVFKAFDSKLKRYVAVKALSPRIASNPEARTRSLREAHATAAVSHPHVATIFAIDEHEKIPFLVMEFVDGKTLQDKIDEDGCLTLESILRIGVQVAQALKAAHAQGLIHRDIKPANILLENDIESVKITDFGLARAVDDVNTTQTGYVGGTPQYMSPEQAAGEKLDHRTDLFSLGSVLYAMCAGRSPFRADSTIAVVRRICDETPKPIAEVNPDIPPWLTSVIHRLLAKDPNDRFQSAAEVADLLAAHLAAYQHPTTLDAPAVDGDDSSTTLPSTEEPLNQTPAKTRKPTTKVLLFVLLLVAVVLATLEFTGVTSLHTLFAPSGPGSSQDTADSPATRDQPDTKTETAETDQADVPSIVHVLTSDKWEWTAPENLGPRINTEFEEGWPQLSADGLTLLFYSYRPNAQTRPDKPNSDLWLSTRQSIDGSFGDPVNLGLPINTHEDELMPTMSADGLTLVFSRGRPGGNRLWMSTRSSTDKPWSVPASLAINGPHYNVNPFLSADGLTLWFKHGQPAGRISIRMSKRESRNEPWPEPVTLKSGGPESYPFPTTSSGDGLTRILADDPQGGFSYVIEIRRDKQSPWSEKIALNPLFGVNSPRTGGNNWDPFLSADGRTLAYESTRLDGFGKRDLWMIRRVKKK